MAKLQGGTRIYGTANVDSNLYVTSTVNAASFTIGSNFTANTTRVGIGVPILANNAIGTAGQVLTSNSTGGLYWYIGPTGYSGSVGYVGSTGYVGSVGYTGSRGTDGIVGYNGSVGYSGSLGYTGSVGYVGSQGIPGEAAAIGYTGSSGSGGSGGGFSNGQSIAVANLAFTNSTSSSTGVAYMFVNTFSNSIDTVFV